MKKQGSIKIKVSPLTFVFAILWFLMGNGFIFVIYFISLLLHELAHAMCAKRLGYAAGRIEISPLGAVLYAECDEFTSKDELKVALAGPLFSLLICVTSVCLWWIYPETYNFTMDFCMANFSIFLLNILPIYPLLGIFYLISFNFASIFCNFFAFWQRNYIFILKSS
jgi:stage IV sporulation protein FB